MNAVLVVAYLLAVVAANLLVAHYGPTALLVTAWLLIPLDLTVKDVLQERWTGGGLVARMAALVLGGSVLSAALSAGATNVAAASFAAFAVAGAGDAVTLHGLRAKHALVRMNGSNAVGATLDSLVFQLVAFGTIDGWLALTQAASKLLGGFVWSLALHRLVWRDK